MKRHFKVAPLSSTFMLTAMVGFLISVIYIPKLSLDWAFAFSLIFLLMFISSMISMTRATIDDSHLDTLAVHEPKKHLKHLRKKK